MYKQVGSTARVLTGHSTWSGQFLSTSDESISTLPTSISYRHFDPKISAISIYPNIFYYRQRLLNYRFFTIIDKRNIGKLIADTDICDISRYVFICPPTSKPYMTVAYPGFLSSAHQHFSSDSKQLLLHKMPAMYTVGHKKRHALFSDYNSRVSLSNFSRPLHAMFGYCHYESSVVVYRL